MSGIREGGFRFQLSAEEIKFLEILSDRGKKTYVHVVKGFGMPLTPMAPTFTNNIAKRLLDLMLVKWADFLHFGYTITPQGLEYLGYLRKR